MSHSQKQISFLTTVLMFLTISIWMLFQATAIKYVIYSFPLLLLLIILLFDGSLQFKKPALIALMTYSLLLIITVSQNGFNPFTIRDILTIGTSLLMFSVVIKYPPKIADWALITISITLVLEFITKGASLSFDFSKSEGILESPLAFPAGALVIYFIHIKDKWRIAISIFLIFITFKRIAMLAIFFSVISLYSIYFLRLNPFKHFLVLAIALICSLIAFHMDTIFEIVAALVNDENVSPNSLALGRYDFWAIIKEYMYQEQTTMSTLFGFGPGSTNYILSQSAEIANPHNDWLKIVFDYGIIGAVIMHSVLYIMHKDSDLGLMLYLYLCFLMITDNTLIYMFYYIIAFVLLKIDPTLKDSQQN